jgi:hypothetical protein
MEWVEREGSISVLAEQWSREDGLVAVVGPYSLTLARLGEKEMSVMPSQPDVVDVFSRFWPKETSESVVRRDYLYKDILTVSLWRYLPRTTITLLLRNMGAQDIE